MRERHNSFVRSFSLYVGCGFIAGDGDVRNDVDDAAYPTRETGYHTFYIGQCHIHLKFDIERQQ